MYDCIISHLPINCKRKSSFGPQKFLLHFSVKCTILIGHTCRCDGMVDVVDSKSTGASLSAACGGVKRRRSRCSGRQATKAFAPRRSSGTANDGDICRRRAATMNNRQRWLVIEKEKHTCRCDGMVDVVDSKSTAGDSVPVRVRSPAPSKRERLLPLSFTLCSGRTRTHLIADVLWTSACRQLDGGNTLIFFEEENVNRVRSPAPFN